MTTIYESFNVESPFVDTRQIPLNAVCPMGKYEGVQPDPNYVFEYEPVRRAFQAISERNPMWIWGPSGCGKTEFLRQVAARLKRPCIIISCGEEMSLRELLGTFELTPSGEDAQDDADASKEGGMKGLVQAIRGLAKKGLGLKTGFRYGQLVRAIRTPGAIVVLDEFNMAPPGVAAQFNRLLEAGELFIPETGERIAIAKGVTFAVTANTSGGMDTFGIYAGSQVQNGATRTRFVGLRMDYLPADREAEILRRVFPDLDKAGQAIVPDTERLFTDLMVEAARSCRVLVEEGEVSLPFSVRQLKNWGGRILAYRDVGMAFRDAYLDMLDPEEATPVAEVFHKHFGIKL